MINTNNKYRKAEYTMIEVERFLTEEEEVEMKVLALMPEDQMDTLLDGVEDAKDISSKFPEKRADILENLCRSARNHLLVGTIIKVMINPNTFDIGFTYENK